MKARTILCALAAAAMLFASCGKDEDNNTNNDNNNTPTNVAANTLVYNGVTYQGEGDVSSENGTVQFSLMGEAFHLMGNVDAFSGSTKTIDLTAHDVSINFFFHLGIEDGVLDIKYQNYVQNYWCFLDGESMNESAFQSGTAKLTQDESQITVVVDGVLKNGKSLTFKLTAPKATIPAIVGTWEYHETSFEGVRQYTETMSFKADGNMSLWFTCYDTYADGSTWHYGLSLTGPYTIDGNKLNFKLYGNGVLNCEDSEFTYSEPDYSGDPRMEYEFPFEISGDTLKVDKGDVALFGHGGHPGVMEYIKK